MKELIISLVCFCLLLFAGCAGIDPIRMDTINGKFVGKVTVSEYNLAPNWNKSWKSMTECEPQLESRKYHWVIQTEETRMRQHGKLRYFHEAVMEAAHANVVMDRNYTIVLAKNDEGLHDSRIGEAIVSFYYRDIKDLKIIGIRTQLLTNHPDIQGNYEYLNFMEAIEADEGMKIVRENVPEEEALNKHRAYITWRMNSAK
jgi:hypothetical protein